ncbi:SDR family oxidoreductase [Pseudomonas sp. BNK-15]|uniref:SDR family oxidoreductase n=1 Tax=Pseudomonas sp. BNK-15 TaxID=3376152 RepID=UPI0039BF58C9
MDLGLKGKRVLVSGASRGIGRAIVELFLQEGARVEFCARGQGGVERATAAFGDQAFGTAVDVTDAQQVTQWVSAAAERMGGLDIVVPNVSALAGGEDLETWQRAFETDLLGSAAMVKAALPALRDSQAASIVLISSVSGREVDMFADPVNWFGRC